MRELAHEVPDGVHYLSGGNSISQAVILLAAAAGRCAAVPLNARLKLSEREAIHNLFGQIDAPPGVFITTSGSQGRPKLVHLSPESLVQHASSVNSHLQVHESDTWLACLPFFHVGGMAIVIRCALVGAGLRIIENSVAELVSESLDGVSIVSLVPTTLRRVLTARGDHLPTSLRAIILGTVGLSRGVTAELSALGKIVIITLMYVGRVGVLVFTFSLFGGSSINQLVNGEVREEDLAV